MSMITCAMENFLKNEVDKNINRYANLLLGEVSGKEVVMTADVKLTDIAIRYEAKAMMLTEQSTLQTQFIKEYSFQTSAGPGNPGSLVNRVGGAKLDFELNGSTQLDDVNFEQKIPVGYVKIHGVAFHFAITATLSF